MTNSNFYIRMLWRFIENMLYLIGLSVVAIAIIAAICGNGDKGLLDLFK